MIETIIYNFFKKTPSNLKKLDKGITNKNYYFEIDEVGYIIRIPYSNTSNVSSYEIELEIINLVKPLDIDISPIYYDSNSGVKISPFKQLLTFDEYHNEDKIIKVAQLMKRLHDAKLKSGVYFDPVKQYLEYKNNVSNFIYNLSEYEMILDKIKKISTDDFIVCHNDWVEGNICFTENKTYLIDYEYAKDNHPFFDIMSFLTENKITDLKQRSQFYDVYFNRELTDEEKYILDTFETYHNMLWCTWAMMMYDQRKESLFIEIANDKYNALINQKKTNQIG